jgi:hypothetical protein
MILAEFVQKKRLSRRKFVLYEDRIALEIKTSQTTSKYEIDIRDLGDELHYHAENKTGGFIILACLFLIPVVMTILMFVRQTFNSGQVGGAWFCCLAIVFLAYIKEHEDDVYLTGGKKNISFFRNLPSEQTVLEFIEQIKRTKKECLKKDYLAYDGDTDEEEYYQRLKWLKEQRFLNGEEYEQAKIDFEIGRLLS